MKSLDFSKLTGEIITKNSKDYDIHRLSWNRAINKSPLAIVYCKTKEDIINAIKQGKENNLSIRIRSGGHHYEGYSTGDEALVIDVSKMNEIYIDEEKNQVKIQGGVRNRELYEETGKRGYPFPGGGCPTVGVAGLVLGGGWGYSARYLGLASDSLIELELINHNGEVIKANKEENSELFWACRGAGGGNFGVVISMTFNLPEKQTMGTLITIDYPNITLEDNIKLIELYQKEFETIDRRVNMKMSNYSSRDKGRGVRLTGIFYGDNKECEKVLAPFKTIIENCNFDLAYLEVRKINTIIQDSHPDYESYKSSGRIVHKLYTREEIKELLSLVKERPEGSIYTAVSLYGLGGVIKEREEGAISYRKGKFIIGYQSVWEEEQYANINRKFLVENFEIIKKLTKGSFINFPLAELEDYEDEYFGEYKEKLREIKKKYDFDGTFNFEQAIKIG
ncbi:MAG: FAD-binding oxidoreductase [Clostridium sp.]